MYSKQWMLHFLGAILLTIVESAIPVTPNMKTFSHAIKDGHLIGNGTENIVFEHNSGPGVVTEQWYAGAGCMDEDVTVKIYIDGETIASLDFNLYMAHGIGVGENVEKQKEIWGFDRLSHTANGGGLQNTYRIPYGSSIRITLGQTKGNCMFWYIVRGVENLPVILGDLILPTNARLRLYKNENKTLNPNEFYTLASVNDKGGALFQSTLKATSSDFNYLTACYRVQIDGGDAQLLSSGTEDFFLSAYFFNQGTFHLPNSGLTYIQNPGFMTAYKFFENDPVLFTKSFVLISRCGETAPYTCMNNITSQYQQGEPYSCITSPAGKKMCYPGRKPRKVQLAETVVTTYTWIYEWE